MHESMFKSFNINIKKSYFIRFRFCSLIGYKPVKRIKIIIELKFNHIIIIQQQILNFEQASNLLKKRQNGPKLSKNQNNTSFFTLQN